MELDFHTISSCEVEWRAFEKNAIYTPYQQYDWLRPWCDHVAEHETAEPLIVFGRTTTGALKFIWPLMLVRSLGLTSCRWLGGKMQNINAGLYDRDWLENVSPEEFQILVDGMLEQRPQIDLLELRNQPALVGGYENPFCKLAATRQGVHPLYMMRILDSFEDCQQDRFSIRSRKKSRKRLKSFDSKFGPVSILDVTGSRAVDNALADLWQFIDARFSKLGIKNPFFEPGMKEFLRSVCQTQILKLHVLEAGGKIRAVHGYLATNRHWSGFVTTMAFDETAPFSPGRIVLDAIVKIAHEQEAQIFDAGLGKENYKEGWFEPEPVHDMNYARNMRAKLYSVSSVQLQSAKRLIRNSNSLWLFAKSLRKILRGK